MLPLIMRLFLSVLLVNDSCMICNPIILHFSRFSLGIHDWSSVLCCSDIQTVYDIFVCVVLSYMKQCVPLRIVRLGRKDPDSITPLIKSLLNKRNKLLQQGHKVEADVLARNINLRIAIVLHHRLDTLADSGVKELWNTVKANKKVKDNSRVTRLTSDVETVNSYFANIPLDSDYNL